MALDPRIILGLIESNDLNRARNIQQQQTNTNAVDANLRAQELQQRIEEMRQRNAPKPREWDPVAAGHEMDYRTKQIVTVSNLLEQATDPDTYEQAKQGIGQILGPEYVQHLPPTFDPVVNARLVAQGKALVAKEAKAATPQMVEVPDPDDPTKTIRKVVVLKEGDSYPGVPKTVTAAALRPVPVETVENGKRVRKFVIPTEGATYPMVEPAGPAGPKPKSVTSGDANKIADLNNSLRDLEVLSGTISGVKDATGPKAAIGAALPNVVTNVTGWGTEAKEKQAMIDRVKQVIGKALEGGVLRKEDEDKYKKILPTISDAPDVVTAKLDGLKAAIDRKRDEQLSALEDAGYDTSKFRARETAAPKPKPKTSAPKKVGRFTVEEVD